MAFIVTQDGAHIFYKDWGSKDAQPIFSRYGVESQLDSMFSPQVTLPSGASGYTRDGALKRSADGLITTSDGYPVAPGITIPAEARSISVNASGEVYAYFTDRVEPELLGQITLAGFTNEKGLEAIGSNLFLETSASGPATVSSPGENGIGTLRQGFLEDSSVDPVREITELIEAHRGYEMNAKVITAAAQMLGVTAQVR